MNEADKRAARADLLSAKALAEAVINSEEATLEQRIRAIRILADTVRRLRASQVQEWTEPVGR
ncbi:MAG TPA: hypothetical protein VFG50_10645 [Rhodothermales bacterium]|nr:hypothetical protein [Rhodothermales bacterium]